MSTQGIDNPESPANQMRADLFHRIKYWAAESDITLCQAIGILEMLKVDLLDMLSCDSEDCMV